MPLNLSHSQKPVASTNKAANNPELHKKGLLVKGHSSFNIEEAHRKLNNLTSDQKRELQLKQNLKQLIESHMKKKLLEPRAMRLDLNRTGIYPKVQ